MLKDFVELAFCIDFFLCRRNSNTMKKKGRESAVTRVLLLVSFAFLFFTAVAMALLYIGLFYVGPKLEQDPDDVQLQNWYLILIQISELPAVANVSFNFLFYILGSNIFRNGFFSMLKRLLHIGQGESQSNVTTTAVVTNN